MKGDAQIEWWKTFLLGVWGGVLAGAIWYLGGRYQRWRDKAQPKPNSVTLEYVLKELAWLQCRSETMREEVRQMKCIVHDLHKWETLYPYSGIGRECCGLKLALPLPPDAPKSARSYVATLRRWANGKQKGKAR